MQNSVLVFDLERLDELRREAERYCDARLWEMLADGYEFYGLLSSTSACRRRAEHYKRQQEVIHEADTGISS